MNAKKGPGKEMWNTLYSDDHTAYGTEANDFVQAVSGQIPKGPVLVLAAGEGRDAVYLAERGHDVTAMDLSEVGLKHAAELASERGVALTTTVADLADYDFGEGKWSGIVSIWAHVPPSLREQVHAKCVKALAPGGVFILEFYAPEHLERPGKGGPPMVELLLSADRAAAELKGLKFVLCQEVKRDVAEGKMHVGPSTTTQVLAKKTN